MNFWGPNIFSNHPQVLWNAASWLAACHWWIHVQADLHLCPLAPFASWYFHGDGIEWPEALDSMDVVQMTVSLNCTSKMIVGGCNFKKKYGCSQPAFPGNRHRDQGSWADLPVRYWTWPIYSGFTHWTWWFSIVMLFTRGIKWPIYSW